LILPEGWAPRRPLSPRRRGTLPEGVPPLPLSGDAPYNDRVADDSAAEALAIRLRTAFDLCEMGESMRRAQLRREHPGASAEEIEALLVAWLETRPGAERGDGWGRSVPWPPSRP
jgi:Rv0078B-related antitoxin